MHNGHAIHSASTFGVHVKTSQKVIYPIIIYMHNIVIMGLPGLLDSHVRVSTFNQSFAITGISFREI